MRIETLKLFRLNGSDMFYNLLQLIRELKRVKLYELRKISNLYNGQGITLHNNYIRRIH